MDQEPAVQPARRERVSQRAALSICRMIRDGNLLPGDSLPAERELASELGVSRASLREALRGLEVAGIVETRHGGGTVVRAFSAFGTESPLAMIFETSHESVSDLWEVRRIIEPSLAERAAVRGTDEEIAWLGDMLEQHREPSLNPNDVSSSRDMDREFHSGVARLTGNQAAEQVIHLLNTLVYKGYRPPRGYVPARRKLAYERHVEIFEAIRDRNPKEARRRMIEHLQEVEEYIFEEVIGKRAENEGASAYVDSSERSIHREANGGGLLTDGEL